MALTTVPASLSATALTLTTAAQPNITSVGTLTGLTVSGNIAGTGNLILTGTSIRPRTDQFTLNNAANNENMLEAVADGAVTLFYDGSSKLATASGGVTVTGTLTATTLAGTLSTAAQTNVTSLGTLSALTVTGTITGSDILLVDSGTTERSIRIQNSAATAYFGVEGSSANRFVGSAANNMFLGTTTADGIQFATNNNVRMVIGSGGSVGIGITSGMDRDLHIKGTGANVGIQIEKTGVDELRVAIDSTGPYLYAEGTAPLRFYQNSGEVLRINSGNIGIGDATASFTNAALHVAKDMGNSVTALVRLRGRNTTARTTRLQFEDYNGAIADGLIDFHFPNAGSTTGAYLGMGFNAGNQLVVGSNANVGIGVTTPSSKLEIRGANGSYTGGLLLTTNSSVSEASALYHDNSGYTTTILANRYGNASAAIKLRLQDASGSPVVALTALGNGNVGIGQARGGISPSASLHVAGENSGYDGTIRIGERGYLAHRDASSTKTWVANNYNNDSATFGIRMKGITDNDEKLTVKGNGYVGIGDTNPESKLHVQDSNNAQILIYETGSSPYTSTLKLASQSITAYGANVQYTSQAEQLTIENFGRALSATSASGGIRFRTKVGNSSMQEVMNINGYTGAVTKPLQPAFHCYGTGLSNQTTEGNHGSWTESFDIGGNFTAGSGAYFTAPVAGRYYFYVHANFNNDVHTPFYWRARHNSSFVGIFYGSYTGGTWSHITGAIIVNMAANDTFRWYYKGDPDEGAEWAQQGGYLLG